MWNNEAIKLRLNPNPQLGFPRKIHLFVSLGLLALLLSVSSVPIPQRFVGLSRKGWGCDFSCCRFAFLSFSLSVLAHSILLCGHFTIALPPNNCYLSLTHTLTHAHSIFLSCFALSPSAVFRCIELLFGLLLLVLSVLFLQILGFEVWLTWGRGVGFDFLLLVFLLLLINCYCCWFWGVNRRGVCLDLIWIVGLWLIGMWFVPQMWFLVFQMFM